MTLLILCMLLGFALISSFLSLSHVSLFSLTSHDLKHPLYKKCDALLSKPRDLLVTLLFSDIFANIMIQNSAAHLFSEKSSWLLLVGFPLMLSLIIGEVVPKTLALSFNRQIAPKIASWISFLLLLLTPLRSLITHLAGKISKTFFFFLKENQETSIEELTFLLEKSEEAEIVDKEEAHWIKGYLFLSTHTIKECMRPRDEILSFDIGAPLPQLVKHFSSRQNFQLPIYQKDPQNILGILTAETYFIHSPHLREPSDILPLLKKPLYVPKASKLSALLPLFLRQKESLALIVDEYGSISGLTTLQDLYKYILGKGHTSLPRYTHSSEDAIIASGKLELNEFASLFGGALPSENKVVTLGGWLMEQLGEIPKSGTTYTWKNFLFQVLSAEPNRVKDVYIRRLK